MPDDDANPKKWLFGDLIENGWASESNPTRVGFFVRMRRCQGLPAVETTDGLGKFWNVFADPKHKMKRIGRSTVSR